MSKNKKYYYFLNTGTAWTQAEKDAFVATLNTFMQVSGCCYARFADHPDNPTNPSICMTVRQDYIDALDALPGNDKYQYMPAYARGLPDNHADNTLFDAAYMKTQGFFPTPPT